MSLSSTLQHNATHCNTLQHAAARVREMSERKHQPVILSHYRLWSHISHEMLQHPATLCNTLQHSATLGVTYLMRCCNTLQHSATLCYTLQHSATQYITRSHISHACDTATLCNTLQHNATRCNTMQHDATLRVKYLMRYVASHEICDSECCSVLQSVAECCFVLQGVATPGSRGRVMTHSSISSILIKGAPFYARSAGRGWRKL